MGGSLRSNISKGKDKLATLAPHQLRLVNYLKQKGEATLEELIENLNLSEEDVRREFTVLRHMEILRATKRGDKDLLSLVLEALLNYTYSFILRKSKVSIQRRFTQSEKAIERLSVNG